MLVTNFGFLDLGAPELILILAIVLLLFGGKKLPQLSKSLGQSMHEIRKGFGEGTPDEKSEKEVSKVSKEKSESSKTESTADSTDDAS